MTDAGKDRSYRTEFCFPSCGKGGIHCIQWAPESSPRAVVQVVHGIAEYGLRYDDFARYLNSLGILVVAEDHMGHGGSLGKNSPKGYFYGGWTAAVDDTYTLLEKTRQQHPKLPYFLLGHSMGSFIARTILYRYPDSGIQGVILSGTAWQPALILKAGLIVCRQTCRKIGDTAPSPQLRKLIFGSYNKRVPTPRTPFDWICSDEAVVEAYTADPLCGFEETCGLDRDMLNGIQMNQRRKNLKRMNPHLPVFFVAGQDDPVGNYGKGIHRCAHAFQGAGMKHVTVTLYPGCRHEILNERDKACIYKDISCWIFRNI